MYGVWGHFQFGTQASMWADPSMLATTVMRFAMYDYDLVSGGRDQTLRAPLRAWRCRRCAVRASRHRHCRLSLSAMLRRYPPFLPHPHVCAVQEAMEAQYRLLADIFYVTFMFSITNLVLWMFLAILLENYTEVSSALMVY